MVKDKVAAVDEGRCGGEDGRNEKRDVVELLERECPCDSAAEKA